MRPISLAGLQSMLAESTGDCWLPAITISGPGVTPVRFVANTVNVTYAGLEYLACPFELTLAPEQDGAPAQAKVRIDNVSRDIGLAIRQATGRPDALVEVFRVDAAGGVHREIGPDEYVVLSAEVTEQSAEATLGYATDFLNEPVVKHTFTPGLAPGLFS